MGKINAAWHEAHPMPKNATEDERVAWHVAHSRACGCRRIEGGVKALLEAHGYRIVDGKVA
jgi:hypothetical protein